MRRWVYTAIKVLWSLVLIMAVILGAITMAVLTEFGFLPDVWWVLYGFGLLIIAADLVVMWKY